MNSFSRLFRTMYINALKIIVAPVVFFSIVTCISGFSDLGELGKIGGRTIVMYLFTTAIAVAVGTGSFFLFQPGSSSVIVPTTNVAAVAADETKMSTIDMLIDIVPSNFV